MARTVVLTAVSHVLGWVVSVYRDGDTFRLADGTGYDPVRSGVFTVEEIIGGSWSTPGALNRAIGTAPVPTIARIGNAVPGTALAAIGACDRLHGFRGNVTFAEIMLSGTADHTVSADAVIAGLKAHYSDR